MARLSTSVVHRWCRRLHEEDEGVSLIEIVIASFILVVAVLGIAATAGSSLNSVRVSRDRDAAATAASAGVEAARDLGFDGLSLADTNDYSTDAEVAGATFSHDGTTFEPLVESPGGVTPYLCTTATVGCWFAFQNYSNLDTAALYVTAFDDPTVDGDGDGNLTNDVDGKRATVVITWTDVTTTRTVRHSTIIAPSKRGLGLPEYQVSPLSASVLVKPNDVVCVQHTIYNAGAQDSYDLTFEKPAGATLDPTHQPDRIVININGKSGNHAWTARAWFGPDAADDMQTWVDGWRDPLVTPLETDATRLKDDPDGDPHLETQYSLPRDESAELHICYEHGPAVANDLPTVVLKAVVRSQLGLLVGEEDTNTLEHTIRVGTSASGLFLSPVSATIGSFQTASPAPAVLASYDGDSVAGLTLRKAANNAGVAQRYVWAKPHDEDGSVSFTRAALRIWTNWDDAIQFGTTPSKMTLKFDVRLCIVPAGQTTCGASGSAKSIAYEHASAGWCEHGVGLECPVAISWDFGTTPQSVGSGEHLLLDIVCTSTSSGSEDDCHFAYGTEAFPARLDLTNVASP